MTKKVAISVPDELLAEVDAESKAAHLSPKFLSESELG
jgi:hypothetical protein